MTKLFGLTLLNLPKPVPSEAALENLNTVKEQDTNDIKGSCEHLMNVGNAPYFEEASWWAANEKPQQQQEPTNRIFVFKAPDKRTVIQAHVHINGPKLQLDRILSLTEKLPNTCELHVFHIASLNMFSANALVSALERTQAKVVSHLVKVTGLTSLIAAMTADEIRVCNDSLICLNHRDENVYGMDVNDYLNCANYVLKSREEQMKQLQAINLFTEEDVTAYLKNDKVLLLHGQELRQRLETARSLRAQK